MAHLRVLALSSRTACFLVAPRGADFAQPTPLAWRLCCEEQVVQSGTATTTAPFVEDLTPDTAYVFDCPLGQIAFRTPPCAGLIDARDHGVTLEAADNGPALQAAIDAVPTGGCLRLPQGRLAAGPLRLKPRMTLWLPEGCTLAALHDWSNWPILPARDATGRPLSSWEGLPEPAFAAPLTALDCPGLTLTGRGVLDAGGDRGDWWLWPKETRRGARRPRALFFAWCDDLQLSGLTIRNAPSWTVHPLRCDRLTACALRIENPPDSPNTDGFNPESCRDVRLTGLDFSVGDDCIAVKAGKRQPGRDDHLAPTSGLVIEHCRMARGHGAVVLGSEMSGDITDVTIRHCHFEGTDRGLRIKTRRGRGGRVARVLLEDVTMTDVPTPLAVNAFYFCDPDGHDGWVQDRNPAPVTEATPQIHDITLRRVTATGTTLAGAALLGLPEAPIRAVTLEAFALRFAAGAQPGLPLMADGQSPVCHIPLLTENAEVSGRPQLIPDEEPISC